MAGKKDFVLKDKKLKIKPAKSEEHLKCRLRDVEKGKNQTRHGEAMVANFRKKAPKTPKKKLFRNIISLREKTTLKR